MSPSRAISSATDLPALATAARLRNATSNASLVLPKDAHLTLTVKTANNAKASEIEVVIYGIAEGVK